MRACLLYTSWIGGPGSVGLQGVANALCGEVNPSGRLVDTYAYDATSSPAYMNIGDVYKRQVMDRIFRKFGLSGKSFIPLLISSGCGIPGIMASKTIENDNDRRLTIMTSTFVPCGAKLPVIALMAGVIGSEATGFPAGALTFIMYVIGVAAVLVSAIILKKTKPFHGDAAPFVMELPAYHLPQAKTVLIQTCLLYTSRCV